MNYLVKITKSDDGEPRDELKWCLVIEKGGTQTLCEGEFFGYGESGCEFETKQTKRGGITCKRCLQYIYEIKKVKL